MLSLWQFSSSLFDWRAASYTLSLGQAVAFFGVLYHWDALADPYCASKYFLIAALCLAYACTTQPQRGVLSVVGLLYLFVLVFVSIFAGKPVCFIGKKLNYFTGVFPMLLVYICYHCSIGDKWERIANSYVAACAIAAAVAISQAYGFNLPQGDYFSGRVYALIGSPVFLSGVLAMAVPLCLGRRHAMATIPLLVTAILLTQSRSGLVAVAVGCIGYAYAKGMVGVRVSVGLAAAAVVAASFAFSSLRDIALSDSGRYHMARIAAKTIREHPIGIGPERFGWAMKKYRDSRLDLEMGKSWTNSYAHNQLLESLVAGGPVLLVVHVAVLLTVGLFLYRFGNPSVFGAATALCAFGMVQPTPLLMKCVIGALAGAIGAPQRHIAKAPFAICAIMAFLASISVITCAKIYQDGLNIGMAGVAVDSFKHQESAIGEQ